MTALALAFQLLVLGLHVVVPWHLAKPDDDPSGSLPGDLSRGVGDSKRIWALVATPLLLAAALAALFTVGARIDAALTWG
ncbi:MAG: hypothetical protein KBF21_07340, partial [Thermoanaerobaculia bacterium]|nr:hypothetical protein [Thermoanaerobaculia bacterium]